MGNSLRCCLSCVIPCGALDVIRIVHLNGRVELLSGPIVAGEVLSANPDHILSKPCSEGSVRRILILSPDSELKRGQIYFLIPASPVPERKIKDPIHKEVEERKPSKTKTKSKNGRCCNPDAEIHRWPERRSSRRRLQMAGRVSVWRPHLDSISEDS